MKAQSRGMMAPTLALTLAAATLLAPCPAADETESPLKVTLLDPKPVKLDAAQMKELKAVREIVVKKAKLTEEWATRQPGPGDMAEMKELEDAIAAARKVKQGIELTLKLTNSGKTPLVVRYGQDTSTNILTVRGPGAVDLPFDGMMTMDYRMAEPVTIAPGGSKEFTITELKYGARDMSRWLITEPGDHQVTLTFRAALDEEKMTEVTSNQVVLKVTTASE